MSSKEYHREYNRKRYHAKRAAFIALLGGYCIKCGETEDLHFDHKDPSQKAFSFGRLLNYSNARVLEELNKCQLLCSSCHISKTRECRDGYSSRAKGSAVSTSKLCEQKVREIFKRSATESDVTLAIEYGVNRRSISNIRRKVTWKHLDLH